MLLATHAGRAIRRHQRGRTCTNFQVQHVKSMWRLPKGLLHSDLAVDAPTATAGGSRPVIGIDSRVSKPSATLSILQRQREMDASGRKVYKFGFGESPFPVPVSIVESLRDAAPANSYMPVCGHPELREVLAEYHNKALERAGGVAHFSPDDIIVGPGTKELLYLVTKVIDCEVVLPAPSWVSYATQGVLSGRPVHWLPAYESDKWHITAATLEGFCEARSAEHQVSESRPRPLVLVLNSPSNPTGLCMSDQNMAELADVCRRHNVVVLSDEIYRDLTTASAPPSTMAKHLPELTIVSNGMSKSFGAGGWRLGHMAVPEQLRHVLEAAAVVASSTFSAVASPIQHAALAAYRTVDEPAISQYLLDSARVLRPLGKRLASSLSAAGVSVHEPDGAFYLFPNFEAYRHKLASRGILTAADLTNAALTDTGVAALPGCAFGCAEEQLVARLCFVDFAGAEALEVAHRKGQDLDESDLQRVAPRVLQGIEQLVGWLERM